MNCGYCFYKAERQGSENGIMTGETADMLIGKIKAYRPSSLTVMFQGGEPTLVGLDFFKSFVRKVKENAVCPVSFALQTNGTLIDDDFAAFFRENDFLIGVSLDGSRAVNDRYRRGVAGESTFDRVMSGISVLKKHGVDFNILSVIDDKNAGDIESTLVFFKEQGLGFLQFIPYVDEGCGVSLTAEKYEVFLKKSFDLWYDDYMSGNYFSVRHIDNYIGILLGHPPENCAMCGVCGSYFVVEANGDLYPCDFYCRDEYRTGSVYDDAPFEINDKHAAFIRESLKIHDKCRQCSYYALCRAGCRRDRIGDLTVNRYCSAYKGFFDYAVSRMKEVARAVHG